MRQGQFKNRSRNRGNRRPSSPLSRVYESNGPDVKVRGTAQHVAEKYLQLARDAQASGDNVMSESYYQHAEHYLRIVAAAQSYHQQQHGGQPQPFQPRRPDAEEEVFDEAEDGMGDEQPPVYAEQPRQPEPEVERRTPPPAPPTLPPAPAEAREEAGDSKRSWDGHQPDFLRRSSAPASPASGNGSGSRPRRSRGRSSQAQNAEAPATQEGEPQATGRQAPESVG